MRRALILLVSSLLLSLASGVSADGRVFENRVKALSADLAARAGDASPASADVRPGNPAASTTIASGSPLASRGAFQLTRQTGGALLRAGAAPFKGGSLTQAGRALTKHPELLGLTKQTLRQTFRTDAALNAAAEGALGGILRSGTAAVKTLPRYGATIEVRGGSGFGARWLQETGEFIGFISP